MRYEKPELKVFYCVTDVVQSTMSKTAEPPIDSVPLLYHSNSAYDADE